MAVSLIGGPFYMEGSRDEEGYRTYKAKFKVKADSNPTTLDGPANVMQCPGLPTYGSIWHVGGDIDVWAWCRWNCTVKPLSGYDTSKGDRYGHYEIEFTFGTKPPDLKKCQDQQISDPLLTPQKVSGGTVKYTEEATTAFNVEVYNSEDGLVRSGIYIQNSAFEQIRGPLAEFDKNRSTVKIVQNVAVLQEALCVSMVDTVNVATLWGFPKRCVKLDSFTWERKFYGTCYVYYERTFEFTKSYVYDPIKGTLTSGFDRDLLDEGTKCIRGHWNTDPSSPTYKSFVIDSDVDYDNPADYARFKDFHGENARVILDAGQPATASVIVGTGTGTGSSPGPGKIRVQKYFESDFLQLGIPTTY